MNASGDFKFDVKLEIHNDTENATELQTFEIIVETLLSEVTVQFWVLVLFGVVIFVVLLGKFETATLFKIFIVRCKTCCACGNLCSRKIGSTKRPSRQRQFALSYYY